MNTDGVKGRKGARENGGSVQTAPNANKLSQFQKDLLVQRIGEYWDNAAINDWLDAEYQITLDPSTFTYYRQSENYADAIQLARAAFNANMDDVSIYSSKWRGAELLKLYAIASKDKQSPARRAECQRILEQAATECPGMAAIAAGTGIQISISEELAAGFGGVKQNQQESL